MSTCDVDINFTRIGPPAIFQLINPTTVKQMVGIIGDKVPNLWIPAFAGITKHSFQLNHKIQQLSRHKNYLFWLVREVARHIFLRFG